MFDFIQVWNTSHGSHSFGLHMIVVARITPWWIYRFPVKPLPFNPCWKENALTLTCLVLYRLVGSQQQPLHLIKKWREISSPCDLSMENYERAPSESLILKVLSIKRKRYNDSRAERNSLINLTFKTIVSSLINFMSLLKSLKEIHVV